MYKSFGHPLVRAGVGLAAAAYELSKRSQGLTSGDPSFATGDSRTNLRIPSTSTVMYSGTKRRSRRSYRRRYRSRTKRAVNSMERAIYVRRCTSAIPISLSAGGYAFSNNISLAQIVNADLVAAFRLYKILKIVLHLSPVVDPGNSGVTNNTQATVCFYNDPEAGGAPSSVAAASTFGNHRTMTIKSGQEFQYTFYPKVANSVGTTSGAGNLSSYASNPWLLLTGGVAPAGGVNIPHYQLNGYIQSVNASSVAQYQYWYEFHFLVKGMS